MGNKILNNIFSTASQLSDLMNLSFIQLLHHRLAVKASKLWLNTDGICMKFKKGINSNKF